MKFLDEVLDALGIPRDPPRTTTAAERIACGQLDGGDLLAVLEDPELQSLHARRANSPEELARIARRTKEVILAQDAPRRGVRCLACGKAVEREREIYALPHCFACLAPPDPLPVRPVGGRR